MAYTTINKSTDYFRIKTFTGNATNNTAITWDESSNMQPDFLWFKNRSQGQSHALFDVIRGADKRLISNSTGAEGTEATNLDSFDTNGFTVDYEAIVNGNNDNMVTWGWKANGAGSANTDGSISSTVSVNTTSGFSIVKWTGNGTAGATVGHGLGVVPKMIIMKNLTESARHWQIYHVNLGNTNYLQFDTNASLPDGGSFNNTSPTSSVFTLGSSNRGNENTKSFIAYCFAEKQGYSKFGSYTGNGSADGTFVYTGFKPDFVITKRTNAIEDWFMFDNKRSSSDGFNVLGERLKPNTSDAGYTTSYLDFVSNGFKWRVNGTGQNGSGDSYIYMAFAEAPLVGTNGVTAKAR